MKALIQRVTEANVEARDKIIGRIGSGILVFLGIEKNDTEKDLSHIVKKIANLRIFYDANGKMNLSVRDRGGEVLVVSQFTIAADCRKGNRPSFDNAEDPARAKELYERALGQLKAAGLKVSTGEFAADMKVSLVNDGPVTFLINSK